MEADRITTFREIWGGLDWSVLLNMLLSVLPVLFCLTVHELCHGLVARQLGDTTAKDAGRLTLNPLKHIDVFGLLMMVFFHFGWAKPVPVDMNRFRNPKAGMALTALAGPVSNVLLAIITFFFYGFFYVLLSQSKIGWVVLSLMATLASLSLSLGVFNLIPIPPLDGSKVLFSVIPNNAYYTLMRYERYGMILLLVLVGTGILGTPLGTAVGWIYDRLEPIVYWGFDLYNFIF